MHKKIISATMLALLLETIFTLTLTIQPTKASPRTIIVPDEYPTIQQAVDAATNGDTIYVRAGTYPEDVVITSKSISLIGQDASNTIIKGVGKGG